MQFLAYRLGRQQKTAQALVPLQALGNPKAAAGSWFCISLVPTGTAAWRVNQLMEDSLPFFLLFSVIYILNKNKHIFQGFDKQSNIQK